jgi:hypothetical protein
LNAGDGVFVQTLEAIKPSLDFHAPPVVPVLPAKTR